MTNKEAKDVLQEQIDRYGQEYDAEGIEALEIAIKALEKTSYKSDARRWKRRYLDLKQRVIKLEEQQPCEDAVSREEAINVLKLAYFNKDLQSAKDDPCIVDAMTDWAIRTIKKLPSVTPQAEPCEDAISRKEALECARLIIDDEGITHEVVHVDDINDLPSMKPKAEPPVDAVSRQAVVDYIKGHIHEIISASGRDLNEHTNQVLRAVIKGVEVLPRK